MSEELSDKLETLKKNFINGLSERANAMSDIVRLGKKIDSESLNSLQTEAHKIAGIAPLYGFDELTTAAKDMDLYILEQMNKFEQNFDEFLLNLNGLNGAFQEAVENIVNQ